MITYGFDPEFFLINSAKQPVSAQQFLTAQKGDKPHVIGPPEYGLGIHADNVTVELTLNRGYDSENFRYIAAMGLDAVHSWAAQYGLTISRQSSMTFEKFHHKNDFVAGCETDLDAYTGDENPPIVLDAHGRGAGGHLHIGFTKTVPVPAPIIVQFLDALVALPLVFDEYHDHSGAATRRHVYGYGTAGSYRAKPYGLEWRVPSNLWVMSSQRISNFVYYVDSIVSQLIALPVEQVRAAYQLINQIQTAHTINHGVFGVYNPEAAWPNNYAWVNAVRKTLDLEPSHTGIFREWAPKPRPEKTSGQTTRQAQQARIRGIANQLRGLVPAVNVAEQQLNMNREWRVEVIDAVGQPIPNAELRLEDLPNVDEELI
jgi:hypothetical protein